MAYQLSCNGFSVSLTSDAYDYNDRFFTLEVTETAEDGENDADHSGLSIDADLKEIENYLAGAVESVQLTQKANRDTGVRRTASKAAAAGLSAVRVFRSECTIDAVTGGIDGVTAHMESAPSRPKANFSPI